VVEIRELLTLPESSGGLTDADATVNRIGQLLGAERLGRGSGTYSLGRAPALELSSVRSVLESGGIAKLYCEHPDGVRAGPAASVSDWTAESDEMRVRGVCLVRESRPGSRRYSIVRLAAEGASRDRTGIKLRLVREILADLHGVRGVISAQLDRADSSGIVALRGCAFAPQAGRVSLSAHLPLRMPTDRRSRPLIIRTDLSEFEQMWQSLLQPLGCTLAANSTAGGCRDTAPGRSANANRCFFVATAEDGAALGAIGVRRADDNEARATQLRCTDDDFEPVVAALLKAVAEWCQAREIRILTAELLSSSGPQIRLLHSLGLVTMEHHLSFARRL
jgi:hypothetical protein